jgi:hypothetical protein
VTARVVALVVDLMDRSRIGAAAPAEQVRFVRRAEEVAGAVAAALAAGTTTPAEALLVVVDLGLPDALDAVAAGAGAGARVLVYGSHVDRERLDAAHAAGAEVLARSAFFSRLPGVLG